MNTRRLVGTRPLRDCPRCVRRRGVSAFTLVELIVVVVILGMIASIAIPRLSRAGNEAPEAALEADLRIVRSAILRYAVEHRNSFPGPTAADFVKQLTYYTDANGAASRTRTGKYRFGPYLVAVPPCPIGPNKGSTDVLIDSANSPPKADTGSTAGWVYNPNTGEFYANVGGVAQAGVTLPLNN